MVQDVKKQIFDNDPDFAWRGKDVTRIENLSDIVFALSLGMLVSASTPPVTASQLSSFLWNIIPVSAAFVVLLSIWNAHFTFFRRYNLADSKAVFLNAVLLLFVLFIAYPLRFIFDAFFSYILYVLGHPDRAISVELDRNSAAEMLCIYAIGYGFIFLILHRLYAHALIKQDTLDLSPREVLLTKNKLNKFVFQISLSTIVGVLAYFTALGPMAGLIWMGMWPLDAINEKITQDKMKKLEI